MEVDKAVAPESIPQQETAAQGSYQAQLNDMNQLNGHCLLLVQFSSNEETRTYMDCKSPDQAFESFMRIYESFLLNKKGILEQQQKVEESSTQIEYKLEDAIKFIEQIFDLGCLCYNEKASGYTAHGKAWFKAKLHSYMRRLAE